MLVVLAIIGTVAAMSLPMIIPMMRRRSIDQATEQVTAALIFARSRAVQMQRMVNVTLLTNERAIIVTDYDVIRGSSMAPFFCAHNLDNYGGIPDDRFTALKVAAVPNGSTAVAYLPDGCLFDLSTDALGVGYDYLVGSDLNPLGVTYVFLPGGGAWCLPSDADNTATTWKKATLTKDGKPAGPIIIGPRRGNANDVSKMQIIVYSMTGQVANEQVQ